MSQGDLGISNKDETHFSSEKAEKGFKVAIVGGGMIGLVCAVVLAQAGVDVEVYEATAEYGSVGGGVGLGPNALRALSELGLLEAVQARAEQPKPAARRFRFLYGSGDHEVIYDCPVGDEDGGLSIQRTAFIEAMAETATQLHAICQTPKIHFSKRCNAIRILPPAEGRTTELVEMAFTDGTSTTADVVLGVDGVRSVVRSYVLGRGEPALSLQGPAGAGHSGGPSQVGLAGMAFMNSIAYRAAVPHAVLVREGIKTDIRNRPHCWIGPEQHIVTFPLRDGEIIHAVAFTNDRSKPITPGPPPSPLPPSTVKLASAFESWGRDIQILARCMDQNVSAWPLFGTWPPLPVYVKGRVALLGDAAHAMVPHLGAGIGQGLEDVVVLLSLLRNPKTTNKNIEAVLSAYDAHRRPHANAVLEASTRSADIFQLHGPSGPTVDGLKTDLSGLCDVVWRYNVVDDCKRASEWLKDKGVF